MNVEVECQTRIGSEPLPRLLLLGTKQRSVVEVMDHWLSDDHRYFRLICDDQATYIVRHDIPSGSWELVLFEQPSSSNTEIPGDLARG